MSQPDPWEVFATEHQRGERLTVEISRIVSDIGLFVAFEGDIFGIVHLSDLDWSTPGEVAIKRYSVGDMVRVEILSIRSDLQRISLGIKQLGSDPRQDRNGEPPAPAPVRPKSPIRPNPQSEAANRE